MTEVMQSKKDPWWVIVLKAAAYVIGLLLAGTGTVKAAEMIGML